jgi:hypothetical protein
VGATTMRTSTGWLSGRSRKFHGPHVLVVIAAPSSKSPEL